MDLDHAEFEITDECNEPSVVRRRVSQIYFTFSLDKVDNALAILKAYALQPGIKGNCL
jgi:hypothetical protein